MYALSYDMQVKPRPSEGKPWLKYFSPEAVAAPPPGRHGLDPQR